MSEWRDINGDTLAIIAVLVGHLCTYFLTAYSHITCRQLQVKNDTFVTDNAVTTEIHG